MTSYPRDVIRIGQRTPGGVDVDEPGAI